MSFLSGLFGRTKYEPTSRTVQTQSKLPEEIAPYITDILEDAQAQYDKAVAEGYQPYGQETIAPRTQEELDAMAGLRGLIGGQGQYIDEAETALRGIDTEFTAEAAQKFMSPYQQAVTDIEKRKAQEDFQRRIMPQFEKQAVGAGGMSGLGSRAGVQAAQLGEAFSQQLGDIQSKGQQKAYEDAYRQFTDQAVRQRAQAEDLRNVGLQRFQTGLAEQGLGQKLAQQDRQEGQNILDKKFLEYLEQEQYPQQQLAQYSGLVYGNPYLRKPDTTETTSGFRAPNAPGIGQQLLGLGLSGLNVFGMGGGFSGNFSANKLFQGPGGSTRSVLKTGGRIVHRQEGGEIPNVYNQGQQVAASPMIGSRSGLGGFFGGIFPRSRQTNVIENIDNAAGSLNDYKETMDENMQNLRMATQAIGSSYNNTFGDRINLLRRIAGPQQATPTVAEMKAGGGLGDLPVIKQQAGSDPRTRRVLARAQIAPMTPPDELTAKEARDITGITRGYYNRALQKYGDQFKGLNFSDYGETINVDDLPAYPNLRSNLISNPETKSYRPDMYGTNTPNQLTTLAKAKSQLPSSKDPTGLVGLRSKIKGANVDIVNRLLERAKEIGERRDVDRATFEAMPEANLATRKEIFEIKNAGNKRLAAQEAANVTELDKMQKGFADVDQKALDDYEKDKIDRLEKARQAWPGGQIAEAINTAMDQPSLVTFFSKAMNLSVAGISKRNEKINDKMDKLKDVMFEKETELRGKNEQRKLNVLDKKQTNLINGILRDTEFKAGLAELPVKYRTEVISAVKSLAALDASKDTTLINIAKVLTDILEETGTGGDANYGIAGGYTLGKLKDVSDLLSTAGLIPVGDVSSGQVKSAAREIQKIFGEVVRGVHSDKIPWNKAIAAKRGSVLKTQEDIVRIFEDRIQKAMQEPSPTQTKDMSGYNKGKTGGIGRTFSERLKDTADRANKEKKDD